MLAMPLRLSRCFRIHRSSRHQAIVPLAVLLAACGGGGGATSQTISGSISGLTGKGLVLQDNLGDNLAIPSGTASFSFPTPVATGKSYSVSVLTQPGSPVQVCDISNGGGTTGTTAGAISVNCTDSPELAMAIRYSANTPTLSEYAIDSTNGRLTLISIIVPPIAPISSSIVMSPPGPFVYVSNVNQDVAASSLAGFTIDTASGGLTAIAGGPMATGRQPLFAIEPKGRFAYISSYTLAEGDIISAFAIDATTGALTPIAGGTVPLTVQGDYVGAISFDPAGSFAYVLASIDSDSGLPISAYLVDQSTGILSPIAEGPTGGGGLYPAGLVASGSFLYLLQSGYVPTGSGLGSGLSPGVGSIYGYTIDPVTGVVTPIGSGPFATGMISNSLVIDPTGKFAYVCNIGDGPPYPSSISEFAIDQATGAMTPIAGSPITGQQCVMVAVEQTGKYAYSLSGNGILTYSINPSTGALALTADAVAGPPDSAGFGGIVFLPIH